MSFESFNKTSAEEETLIIEKNKQAIVDFFTNNGQDKEKEKILSEYYNFIDKNSEEKDIKTIIKKSSEFIEKLIKNEIYPIITVPEEKWEEIKKEQGPLTKKNDSWIPGFKKIVGVVGIEPYEGDGKKRVLLQIECESKEISPRITGPKKNFNGVVIFNNDYIPFEKIKEMGFINKENFGELELKKAA
jgi:hypothetical protein